MPTKGDGWIEEAETGHNPDSRVLPHLARLTRDSYETKLNRRECPDDLRIAGSLNERAWMDLSKVG